MGYRGTHDGCTRQLCKNWRNVLSSQIVPQMFPHNQLASSSSWGWVGREVSGADQEGCKEEHQTRIEEQRTGQALKYAPWKEKSPKMPQSHRLKLNTSLETSTILLKVYLRNINVCIHTCVQGLEREISKMLAVQV